MKLKITLAGGAAAAALAFAGPADALVALKAPGGSKEPTATQNGATAGTGGKRETYGQQALTCSDGNSVVYDGPLEMWPPNHKYRDLEVTATDNEPSNTVTLTTTGTHDEYVEDGTEMNGAGNTDNDFFDTTPGGMASGQGSATTSHRVRGERSGRGDGRTYRIHALATFSDGERCEGDFFSTVPHDQGKGTKGGTTAKKVRVRR